MNATEPKIEISEISQNVAPKIKGSNIIKSFLKGTQNIIPSKRETDPREVVTLFMLHLRLKDKEADILITLNVPKKEFETQSYQEIVAYHTSVFETINKSIEIRDLSLLFG